MNLIFWGGVESGNITASFVSGPMTKLLCFSLLSCKNLVVIKHLFFSLSYSLSITVTRNKKVVDPPFLLLHPLFQTKLTIHVSIIIVLIEFYIHFIKMIGSDWIESNWILCRYYLAQPCFLSPIFFFFLRTRKVSEAELLFFILLLFLSLYRFCWPHNVSVARLVLLSS